MTYCERLSDRMPDVSLGRARWTAGEETHLAGCADCRTEWELVRAAGRLAARAPGLADDQSVAAALVRRLAEPVPPARRRLRPWIGALAAAAGIALAVWAGAGENDRPLADAPGDRLSLEADEVAELDSLGEAEQPVAGWYMLDTPTLGELSEEELERVLVTLEG